MWRGAAITLAVSVTACALSRVTGHLLLVNPAHGTLRMDGTQPEPAGGRPCWRWSCCWPCAGASGRASCWRSPAWS